MGDLVPLLPTERSIRWGLLPTAARVYAARQFAEARDLEGVAALELLAETMRVQDHPAGPDADAAIERAFDTHVRQPLGETLKRFAEQLGPMFQQWSRIAESFLEVARASGLDQFTPGDDLASCHCLCGQHWDRPGVCEGLVPESAIVPYLLDNGATISVCAECAAARRACAGRAGGQR